MTASDLQYVLPSIMDLDDLFARTPNTIVFNDIMLDRSAEEIIDTLCDISDDESDLVASCTCGAMSGNYYEGQKCSVCGTTCVSSLYAEIRNDTWLEIPASITAVLNPQVFRMLSAWMGNTKNKQPILKLMLNMQVPSEPIQKTPFFTGMGFNWFYANFDTVIEFFLTSHPGPTGRAQAPSIRRFLQQTGKAIWCTKLPILSKVIQPIAKASNRIRYADDEIRDLIKAIFNFRSILISEKLMRFTADHVDRNFYDVYGEFLSYTNSIMNSKLPKKPSILRKHVFGSRSHCTSRSVAVPITGPHDDDEIYLPWKLGIMMYKYHIISVLVRNQKMSVYLANNRVMNAINVYDHEIDLIMQQLITDCPYKGLPILMNRNPSLRIGSIQLLFVTKIKPALKENPFARSPVAEPEFISFDSADDDEDLFTTSAKFGEMLEAEPELDAFKIAHQLVSYVEDGTIGTSPMIVKGPNLDYDGDEINIIPIFEMTEVPKYMRLYPAHRIISNSDLAVQGDDITISSQQYCILNGWMNDAAAM